MFKTMTALQSFSTNHTDADRCVRLLTPFVLLASLLSATLSAAAPAPGKIAPDFALRTFGEGNLRLSEFRGEVVIVNFWATWCGPCQQELPRLERLHQRYEKAGLVLLGINLDDDMDRGRTMAQRLTLSFPMLFDRVKDVARLYELESMPMTVFIDREGVIRHVHETFRKDDESLYLEQIRHLLDE
jgi:peroxiredoxin